MSYFLAFRPDPTIRADLSARVGEFRQNLDLPGELLRWHEPERWHVTLRYFGALEPDRLEEVRAEAANLCRLTPPLPLSLHQFQYWAESALGYITLRCQGPSAFQTLASQLGVAAFDPHLTLCEAKRSAATDDAIRRKIARVSERPPITWMATEAELLRAFSCDGHRRYEPIAALALSGS